MKLGHTPTAEGLPEWQVDKIMEARVNAWADQKHREAIARNNRARVRAQVQTWSARRRKHAA